MGVNLTPISVKRTLSLEELDGRRLAVDALGELYQFLALIRLPDGTPLADGRGHITSHLAGLFYRTTRLVAEHRLRLIFVFDGRPPALKRAEIERRREIRERYSREHAEAVAAGDLARAYSKSTMTSRMTGEMLDDARRLLDLLGIPWLVAPGEGEAQAAAMAARGEAWAAVSKDYDCLLFGTPRLVRFLTLEGREFLPSRGVSRPITPELIETEAMLAAHGLTRAQLVDLAILVGTDFHPGVHGIGPKKALRLIQKHGSLDDLPVELREALGTTYPEIRALYLAPEVTSDYDLEWREPDEAGLVAFLCGERAFDPARVERAVERMRKGL
jgi:flap endonuclease-1